MRGAEITRRTIDFADALARVGDPADGAVLLFLGTVREQNDGLPVSGMRYDAFDAMATDVLRAIVEEAGERFGLDNVYAVHRAGELAIGEVSVAIAVSSPHRAQAYDASRYVIEQIKQRLPVWKQERYIGGDSRWLEGHVPTVEER